MNSVRDPYTVYLSPREIQGLNESLSGGNFGGIGVYIYQLKDGRIVVQPIEAMPAARAGMKPGEVVDTVDGKPVRGLSIDRVEEMIRGEAGTIVHLRAHAYNAAVRRSIRTQSFARSFTCRPCARRWRVGSNTSGSPISVRRRPTRFERRCSTDATAAHAATSSIFAITAEDCSTRQSRYRASSSRRERSYRRFAATASAPAKRRSATLSAASTRSSCS